MCVGGGGRGGGARGEERDTATPLYISGHAYILCLMRSVNQSELRSCVKLKVEVAVRGSRP